MRKLIASAFVSLDGIMQTPGGPDEDPSGGFTPGGWTFHYWAESMDPGTDLQIIGSSKLVQTLQAAALIDEYKVWIFPVVLGRGKRLFSEASRPSALRLVRSQVSTTGVVMSAYVPAGAIQPGSFTSGEPSERELARRQKMANGIW